MRRVVDVTRRAAGACAHRGGLRIDTHAAHHRQVNHETIVDAPQTGPVVSAAPNGDAKLPVPPEIDC